jgi:type IV pilus biogenesis protein CpaD/CtpE
MSSRLVLLMAAAAALGACSTVHKNIGEEDAAFGEAAKYNAAIQTINPAPVYGENEAQPGDNGEKGAAAVKRYRSDLVKKVEAMQTSGGTSSGGSTPH